MKRATWIRPPAAAILVAAVVGVCSTPPAWATLAYKNSGPFVSPLVAPLGMPDLPAPARVPSKEYSHDSDATTMGAGAIPPPPADPEQVINWDGYGGTFDGVDYTLTRPTYLNDGQIDALAQFYDTLFMPLRNDRVHLVFSIDDTLTAYSSGSPSLGAYVPSAGPVSLSGGSSIGGAGELSYELAGAYGPSGQGLWAAQATINGEPLPIDIDGVELWGNEPNPGGDPPVIGDANKYSLESDYASYNTAIANDAVSVWNDNGTPFLPHSMVVSLVTSVLGTPASLSSEELTALIDVDALMVQNLPFADPRVFDAATPFGPDEIIFSIRQIADPADTTGYYATGSELFILDGTGGGGILVHGGHAWDKAYALASLRYEIDEGLTGVVDVNAIEAVAVPEPSGLMLLALAVAAFASHRWR